MGKVVKRSSQDVPDEVFIGFVRSLFKEAKVLLIGGICHSLVALLVYSRSEEQIYLWFAAVLLAAGIIRYVNIVQGRKAQITTIAEAYRWERAYLYTGTFQALMMGLFCFVALYYKPDVFAEIGAIAVVMGSSITIVGRNYGSKKMVLLQSLAVLLPMAAGMIMKEGYQFTILGFYLIPFVFVILTMSSNVRMVLFDAISQEARSRRLAQRFDQALNTMSYGLVMFGNDGRAAVVNARAAEILGFSSISRMVGRTLPALITRAVVAGLLSKEDKLYTQTKLLDALHQGRDQKVLLRLIDGRYLEFSAREGRDELRVLIFDEVTERIAAEEKVLHMARYDSLTGLANRAYFHEVVTEFIAQGNPDRLCGLAVFDLDDFKNTNDTLGHPVGDMLIRFVADHFSSFASDNIKISRFGGDEFMVFFNHLESEEDFVERATEILERLRGDFNIGGHTVRVQVSAGGVLAVSGSSNVNQMIVEADLALYRAKDDGKNGWSLFEGSMEAEFRERALLKDELRSAIEQRKLGVVFQPIIDIRTMQITGCEALCRWDHPYLGAVSPGVFIPLAENMGMISEISAFVLEEACRECAEWPPHLVVSVNLSAKDFYDSAIVQTIQRTLSTTRLPPHRLEIEVTETAILDDKSSARNHLEKLRQLGVGIALDDFGTGYSSLSYLHRLPLSKVKVDGSFIADIGGDERSLQLLKSIVDLSRTIGLSVTVEGVESFEQLRILTSHIKPDYVQGFLFGSALTSSGIHTMTMNAVNFTKAGTVGLQIH